MPLRARAGVFVVVLTSVISALAVLSWLLAASELLILVNSGGGPEGMLTLSALLMLEFTVPAALVLTALAGLGWWWRYSTRTALVVAMVAIAGRVCWFVADNRAGLAVGHRRPARSGNRGATVVAVLSQGTASLSALRPLPAGPENL